MTSTLCDTRTIFNIWLIKKKGLGNHQKKNKAVHQIPTSNLIPEVLFKWYGQQNLFLHFWQWRNNLVLQKNQQIIIDRKKVFLFIAGCQTSLLDKIRLQSNFWVQINTNLQEKLSNKISDIYRFNGKNYLNDKLDGFNKSK